ncbi:hypothetical protein FEM48_Zijuj07G0056500 [Ziziphus jujuba var. spinosa]|uniref:Bet v I/Major latex protein domain-containing protein n=1 Tax=Ziziphus jujuba var. spinosa TaxID=714518 RepID=A0A978V2S6_ZIZJJ|nr:hypothetical protein FEM48_Zijuj07G0056500 [Ziziphus jujuba var. spinosa]
MSTVLSYGPKFTSFIPPARLFKALALDADQLFPKIAPNAVNSVEIIDGDGGSHFNYSKQKIEVIDKDHFVYAYSLTTSLRRLVSTLTSLMLALPQVLRNAIRKAADGGSIIKSIGKYHTKSDDHDITEDKIKAGKEKAAHLFKVVEKYLQENPDAYN